MINCLKRLVFINAVLFYIFLFNGCSSDKELISNWTNHQIKIDGATSDWQNNLEYLSDENIALGFKNDSKYLYICLATSDFSKVFPMFRSGFIIWFEPENDGKIIGIKYPMHNILSNGEMMPNQNERANNNEDHSEFIQKMLERQNEMQILNEDKHPLTDLPTENKEGIKAKLGYNSDRFVYELQVPLGNNNLAYQISALPGENIKVKFETEELDRKNFQGRGMRPDGGMGGERPGGFGGGRSRGGMRPGMNNGRENFEPLNFSVNVALKKD